MTISSYAPYEVLLKKNSTIYLKEITHWGHLGKTLQEVTLYHHENRKV